MRHIPFHASTSAFGDWIIVAARHDRHRATFADLGATRTERSGHVLYSWRLPEAARVVSGFAIINGALLIGPTAVDQPPTGGLFEFLDLSDPLKARISGDFACTRPIFYSDKLVTNRLHLAAVVEDAIDETVTRAMLFSDYAFSQQLSTTRTPVANTRLLLGHQHVEVTDRINVVSASQDDQFEILSPAEYHALIERGAEEIQANVAAVLNSGFSLRGLITGGRDSRVVFAALASLGAVEDVSFLTSDVGRDVEIATGLVRRYGGRYGFPEVAPRVRPAVECDHIRRSQKFGCYHIVASWEHNPIAYDVVKPDIILGGGFGELYRGFYQSGFKAPRLMEKPLDKGILFKELQRYSSHLTADNRGRFGEIVGPILETFDALPGRTLSHKLDAHYLNFRNRFHFGQSLSCRITSDHEYFPLMSESLLRAARGLPHEIRVKGRVLFDVTRSLCPELAYLPYDKPWASSMDDAYHLPSPLDGKDFTLEPCPETIPYPKPVMVPPHEWVDQRAMFMRSIRANIETLKASPYRDLMQGSVLTRIDQAIENGGNYLSVWFSKLQALADFSAAT